ncbi:recombinase family protein [Streptomyces sp. MST-110588]|uniref:recombinase family protein n=1 Tax=Streptomyces sp. MST-110588 TaxID=2833628 RepID=UPI001F5D709F|nr:recombinase family protein [Streptomyces sp. MST-110588]UNO42979.1 recombinase family protein [Streptomyces sp. MST-110588]
MTHDDLPSWLPARRATTPAPPGARRGLRFGFYGRVSTEDQQDPEASRQWQLGRARALIEPAGGAVVSEYFDTGQTRTLPWKRRPRAVDLLARLADPQRGFDAVVIGEPQRAFYGSQFGNTFPLFTHFGVPLWVPEVGGAIDPDNEAHDLIMSVFGGMSKGERNRIKIRVRAAMAALTLVEGRYLGGRPPYGYRLVDLGPHPNPGKAALGKRLSGLEPDPVTAHTVVRIFTEFLRGLGIFAIAEGLTRDGIPSPSAHDPARNRHRDTRAWAKSAVRAILGNPRYTGRQVWNRQHKHETLLDIQDVTLGHTTVMRWNGKEEWIVSRHIVHTPLIDDDTFAAAQDLLHTRATQGAPHPTHRTRNPYLFRGRITCGSCTRRMQGQWSHGEAYYRCRFPEEYALVQRILHPRNVYLRESWITPPLDDWLGTVFAPHRLDDTIDSMAATEDVPEINQAAATAARATIAECDAKLTTHRAALEAGADPAVVTRWLAETQAARARAQADLRTATMGAGARMSRDEIAGLVRSISDLIGVIREAAAEDKTEIYRHLGLQLTYDPSTTTVRAEITPSPPSSHTPNNDKTPRFQRNRGEMVCVRGGT